MMSRTNVMSLLRRYRFLLLLVLAILFLLATGILPPNIGAIGMAITFVSVCVLELRRRLSNKLTRVALLIALIASWGYALVLAFLLFMSGGVVYPGATFAGTWVDSYGLHLRYKVSVDDSQPYDYYQNQIAKIYLNARYWPNITTQPEIWCDFPNISRPSTLCIFQSTNITFGTSPAKQTGAPINLITVQAPFCGIVPDATKQPYWMLNFSFSDNLQPDLPRDGTLIQIDRILIQPDELLDVTLSRLFLIAGIIVTALIPIPDLLRRLRLAAVPLIALMLLMAFAIIPLSIGLIGLLLIVATAAVFYLRRLVPYSLVRHTITAATIIGWGYIAVTAYLLFMNGGINYPNAISTTRWIDSTGAHIRYNVLQSKDQAFHFIQDQINAIYLNTPAGENPPGDELKCNRNTIENLGASDDCSYYGTFVSASAPMLGDSPFTQFPLHTISVHVPFFGPFIDKQNYSLVQPNVYWSILITFTDDSFGNGTTIQIDHSLTPIFNS